MRKTAMLAMAWLLGISSIAAAQDVAGYLGDQPITVEEVDALVERELTAIRQQEFDIRSQGLDRLINKKLLEQEAERRGLSVEELVRVEVEEKIGVVSDLSVSAFYETNKARMGGRSLEEVSDEIRRHLGQQARGIRNSAFVVSLRKDANLRVLLEPPRVDVPIPDGEPSLGPADAAVTIVEFSDFECPYCKRAHPTVERILKEYGDRIRFVYRDYPLPNHPRAIPASKAARCAGEQDRYWEYHTDLMSGTGDLSDGDLTRRAEAMELDMEAFNSCVASDRHDAKVRAGLQDGARVGVSGTPAFFINGRLLSGAQPYEAFRKILDDELARAGTE